MSTIRHAGQVLFLKDGQIRERGTHDELLALGEQYSELYTSQFQLVQQPD